MFQLREATPSLTNRLPRGKLSHALRYLLQHFRDPLRDPRVRNSMRCPAPRGTAVSNSSESSTPWPLGIPDAVHARALHDHCKAQLSGSGPLDPILRLALTAARDGLQAALDLEQERARVEEWRIPWEAARETSQQEARALAAALRRTGRAGFRFDVLTGLATNLLLPRGTPVPMDLGLGEDGKPFAVYRANPAGWVRAVQQALAYQKELTNAFRAARETVDGPASEGPGEPGIRTAVHDCAGLALRRLEACGSGDIALDRACLEEAMSYAAYGQGFRDRDVAAIGARYRTLDRNRDLFLETFTTTMRQAAERFTEEESLAWQASRAERHRVRP